METKDIIKTIRKTHHLSQTQLAEKLNITRQAVSRWESGITFPNQETLKQLSTLFDLSINKILDAPKTFICQCCGMPLDEEINGKINKTYCKWCYTDGKFIYKNLEQLLDFLVPHLSNLHQTDPKDVRTYLEKSLLNLDMWKEVE